MGTNTRTWIVPLVIMVVLAVALRGRAQPADPAGASLSQRRVVGQISDAERAATFTFPPGIAGADRQAILQALADARPEAQRLIAEIDGLVDLKIADAGQDAVGTTEPVGRRFVVTLNLGWALRIAGRRGIDRLVLHELGHVVDFALVPAAMNDQLDAEIPRGYGCEEGRTGACANIMERFAETFMKWATNDIGVGVDLGYKIPPPDDLESWGAPLASLLKT